MLRFSGANRDGRKNCYATKNPRGVNCN